MASPVKIVKALVLAIIIFLVVLLGSLVAFIKSPLFAKAVTSAINKYTDVHVEIGSLYFGKDRRIIGDNLKVREKRENGFLLELPHAEISARLSGIIRKHIDEIILVRPVVAFIYKGDKRAKPSLPFTFSRVSVSDADVTIRFKENRVLHVSALSVSLERLLNEKYARLSASAFVSDINSGISATAEVDIDRFDFVKARLEATSVDLSRVVDVYPVAFLNDKELKGSGTLLIEAERKDTADIQGIAYKASMSVENVLFRAETMGVRFEDRFLSVESQGVVDQERDSAEIMSLSVRLSSMSLPDLHGTIKHLSGKSPVIDITAEGKKIPLHEIKNIVSGPAVSWIKSTDVHGFADARLTVSGTFQEPEIKGEISVQGKRFRWKNMTLGSFELGLPFEYAGQYIKIRNASARVDESLYRDPADKNDTSFKVMKARFTIPSVEYSEQALKVNGFQIRADSAGIYRKEKESYAERGVVIRGSLEGSFGSQKFRVKDLLLDTDFFRNVSGTFDVTAAKNITFDGFMKYGSFDIEKISERFLHTFITGKGYSVSGNGTMNMSVHGSIPDRSGPQLSGTLSLGLTDTGFSSEDWTKAVEGIRMNTSVRFRSAHPYETVELSADAEATGFELLWDKFYGSFKDRKLNFSASGIFERPDSSLSISASSMNMTGIGEMRAQGKISHLAGSPSFRMEIQIPSIDNRGVYDFFVRETFQAQTPLLSRIEMDGRSAVSLSLGGTQEHFTAKGNIRVADMNIREKGTAKTVSGIQMSLPVEIEYPAPTAGKEDGAFGSLSVESVSWGAFELKNIEMSPAVRRNMFVVKEDITIPVMGGDVILRDISYGDILSEGKKLSLAADIKKIDLDQLSAAYELPKFSGSLSGSIPQIILAQDRLLTEGQVDLDIFGGKMKVDNLSMDNVFSPIASLKTDIEFDGIHLEQVTSTFDFGHISGVVRGEVKDLVVVKGQAEKFIASLESYKEKGISQKISVEALKKISILGTGASPSVLDRGIYRFFRDYRYEKLGFRALLKNDSLLLLGINNEGNKGYLVQGGIFPPKVDVINYTHNISFKEMVSRLKRIKQAER